jgi:DTW domain-containing protein YfiP
MTCVKCGLTFQCICKQIPQLTSNVRLSLLTHENEYHRQTNTGKWLIEAFQHCERYQWQRNQPNSALMSRIKQPNQYSVLLYPSPDSRPLEQVLSEIAPQNTPHFILLDGTWQEAKKMEKKCPWLDQVQRVSFSPSQPSNYRLRRRQQPDHLCTLEVVVELLKYVNEEENSRQLSQFFNVMMNCYLADKSGHAFK